MINLSEVNLTKLVVHKVGNKTKGEGVKLSGGEFVFENDSIKDMLQKYFLSPFKGESFFNFTSDRELDHNRMYRFASQIFDSPKEMHEVSGKIAEFLYDATLHPKINGGEFYVVYLKECFIDDEVVDAIGLFRSENKETYLKVMMKNDNIELGYEDGININKLDKGCIIFNTDKENGYTVAIVDNVNRNQEAAYWRDDFLQLKQRADEYHYTENYLRMCKDFCDDFLPQENTLPKNEQLAIKNNSLKYFQENKEFAEEDFAEKVIAKPEIIESFKEYKTNYNNEREIETPENFEINPMALRKTKGIMRSVLKLDKNFHIYIHGDQELIERGYDEVRKLNYYKVYYIKES